MKFRDVPNLICGLRIACIPVLWVLAALGYHHVFAAALAGTWLTDAVDGWLARTYHLESKLGAKLDSIADNLVQLSMLGWVYLLRREIYTHYTPLVAILVVLFVGSMILQVRRRAPLHTWANKLTAWLLALFLLYTFLWGVQPVFLWVTFVALAYAMGEGIILLLWAQQVDEDTRSLWQRRHWIRSAPPAEEPQ